MRFRAIFLSFLFFACGSSGNSFDLKLKGEAAPGQPVDMSLRLDAEGAGSTFGTFTDPNSNYQLAPRLILVGLTENSSHVSGSNCIVSPCPKIAQLRAFGPPTAIYAGPWHHTQANIAFQQDGRDIAGLGFDDPNDFTLNFEKPSYSGSGDTVFSQNGTVVGSATVRGSTVRVEGSFHVETQCNRQELSFRGCGNAKAGDGRANPLKQAYLENTCPAELVKPYEASPTWSGNTLHLGDINIDCRATNNGAEKTDSPSLQCFRHTSTKAGGCSWDVYFQTDGDLQAFSVAAFADSSCATKTCNTYR